MNVVKMPKRVSGDQELTAIIAGNIFASIASDHTQWSNWTYKKEGNPTEHVANWAVSWARYIVQQSSTAVDPISGSESDPNE